MPTWGRRTTRAARRPHRLPTWSFVVALVASMALVPAGSGAGQESGATPQSVVLQQPQDVFGVPAIVVADPSSGRVQTYDLNGNANNEFAEQGYADGDAVAFGHFTRHLPPERNQDCIVIARAETGVLDFCSNTGSVTRFLAAEYQAGDGLAVGNVSSNSVFDEVLIARADTGRIDVLSFSSDPTLGMEVVASFDAGFTPGDFVAVPPRMMSDRVQGPGAEVVLVSPARRDLRVFKQDPDDETEFTPIGGVEQVPVAFDTVAVGTIEPFPRRDQDHRPVAIAVGDSSTGIVSVFRYSFVSLPRLLPFATLDTAFGDGSALLLADVHANTTDSLLVTNPDTGLVDVFSYSFEDATPLRQVESLDLGVPADAGFDAYDLFLADADGDGLFDIWETEGLDANGNGLIDVNLPALGADPLHKDLFVELDWTFARRPTTEVLDLVVEAFALAPMDAGGTANPSGRLGIDLHIDTGQLGGGNELREPNSTSWSRTICDLSDDANGSGISDFYEAKAANFDPLRSLVFRYGISARSCGTSPGGQAEVGGNDFIVFNASSPLATSGAGTLMHELGHNLNLGHGGPPDRKDNCKPNHVSIMSYSISGGIERIDGSKIVDFSPPRIDDLGTRGRAPLDTLDERELDESAVLDPTDPVNTFVFKDGKNVTQTWPLLGLAFDPDHPATLGVDWNGDKKLSPGTVEANVDNFTIAGATPDEDCQNDVLRELKGHDDWSAISLPFRQFGESSNGPVNLDDHRDPTEEEIAAFQEEINTTDLAIGGSASPQPGVAGRDVVYTFEVTNNGPRRASLVEVQHTLPEGAVHAQAGPQCEVDGRDVTCAMGRMERGDVREVQLTVAIAPDVVFRAGGPTVLTSTARVSDAQHFARDPDPANNEASIDLDVVGESDLVLDGLDAPEAPVEVLLEQPNVLEVGLFAANRGPSGPTDVAGALKPDASPALVVEETIAFEVEALDVAEQRGVTVHVELVCSEPGLHDLSLAAEISPSTPGVHDPDPSNARRSTSFTVHCIVPMAIDVRQQSINLDSQGLIPVTARSTQAGERGLPRAFDATSIDPESVLFGRIQNLIGTQSPSGAPAFQGRGNIQNEDMLLRFRTDQTGLQPDDKQACMRGEAVVDGARVTFLGCDEVVIRR